MPASLDFVKPLLPALLTFAAVLGVLIAVGRLLGRGARRDPEADFRNKLIMLALSLAGLVLLLVAAPIPADTRGQLLGFLGIVFSAAIALSSTTILGNALAGIMLRAVGNFRVGDFVEVEGCFGRVTERGLFHTEIQTEARDLITLPNMYLVTHAVSVVRSSGHVVRADVSLGYDVPRGDVERCLLAAAAAAGLEETYVHIMDLGDFSVTYRVGGLLKDVKSLLSGRSRLRAEMLDALHGAGVEIVSPTFMNQRVHPPESRFVPRRATSDPAVARDAVSAEDVAFDKAEEAETLESLRIERAKLIEELGELKGDASAAHRIAALETRLAGLDANIAAREADRPDGSA